MYPAKLVTKRNFVFWIILCLLLSWGCGLGYSQEFSAIASADDEFGETLAPIPTGACFLNYGFGLTAQIGFRQTYQEVSGRYNKDSTLGTNFDSQKDLGMDRHTLEAALGLGFTWEGWRLSFEYSRAKFSGENLLTKDLVIHGASFANGTQLDSEAKFEVFRWLLGYTIFANHRVGVGVDLEFDVIRLTYAFEGTEPGTGLAVMESDRKVAPFIKPGLHIDFALSDPLVFTLAVNGIIYKQEHVEVATVRTSLTGRIFLNETVFLFAESAYEYIKLTSHKDDTFEGNMLFHSWLGMFGLGLHF